MGRPARRPRLCASLFCGAAGARGAAQVKASSSVRGPGAPREHSTPQTRPDHDARPQLTRTQRTCTGAMRALLVLALLVVGVCLSGQRAPSASAFFIDERQSPRATEWTYDEQQAWPMLHRECAGRAQSPIDIQHRNVITSQHLKLQFYNYNKPLRFKLANAHHTIKMNPFGLATYDQELMQADARAPPDQQANQARARNQTGAAGRDLSTADEYVEFTSAHGGAPADNGGQLSRLTVGESKQRPGGPAHSARAPKTTAELTGGASGAHIEREQASGGGGGGLELGGNSLLVEGSMQPDEAAQPSAHEPYAGAPTIKLDWLDDDNNEYKLRDIHFHWGERRDNGSEHAIDGRRAAMEMHLVHIRHGLDRSKIGFTSDSVTVIAILIESHRKSNADFNPIVNELSRINATERAQEIDYKSLYDLLPSNLQAFYTYSGSLTTPPCYQVVNWIVMAERLNMNAKQIEMFRNLYAPPPAPALQDDDEAPPEGSHSGNQLGAHTGDALAEEHGANHAHLIMPNVRNLQPGLNNRTILASFTRYGSRLEAASANLYATSGAGETQHAGAAHMLLACQLLMVVLVVVRATLARPTAGRIL